MGKVIDVVVELRKDNPRASDMEIRLYADALGTYREAAKNIAENGAVCQHPRTGAPMENPYLKIRAQHGAILGKMTRIKSDRVLGLIGD